jgi:hypothetical protein
MRTPIQARVRALVVLGMCAVFPALYVEQHRIQAGPAGAHLSSVTDGPRSGTAYFYSPGMFNVVARNRGIKLRDDVDGYAAVPDCQHIGSVVRARINNRSMERYQVLDCSAPRDRARHLRQGLVIEVDYQSAVRNNFARKGRAPASVFYP